MFLMSSAVCSQPSHNQICSRQNRPEWFGRTSRHMAEAAAVSTAGGGVRRRGRALCHPSAAALGKKSARKGLCRKKQQKKIWEKNEEYVFFFRYHSCPWQGADLLACICRRVVVKRLQMWLLLFSLSPLIPDLGECIPKNMFFGKVCREWSLARVSAFFWAGANYGIGVGWKYSVIDAAPLETLEYIIEIHFIGNVMKVNNNRI